MPFSNDGTLVADLFENLSDIFLFDRNTRRGVVGINSGIGGKPKAVLVATCEKTGPVF